MLQRTLPAGFIAPCLPTNIDKLPLVFEWRPATEDRTCPRPSLAKKFAPREDDKGVAHWENPRDELRFMRFLAFSGRCAAAPAQFESPKYAAVAVANQSENTPDIYKQDPYKVMDDIVDRWIAAEKAEKAERMIDVTPAPEPEPVEVKPNPDDGIDEELA